MSMSGDDAYILSMDYTDEKIENIERTDGNIVVYRDIDDLGMTNRPMIHTILNKLIEKHGQEEKTIMVIAKCWGNKVGGLPTGYIDGTLIINLICDKNKYPDKYGVYIRLEAGKSANEERSYIGRAKFNTTTLLFENVLFEEVGKDITYYSIDELNKANSNLGDIVLDGSTDVCYKIIRKLSEKNRQLILVGDGYNPAIPLGNIGLNTNQKIIYLRFCTGGSYTKNHIIAITSGGGIFTRRYDNSTEELLDWKSSANYTTLEDIGLAQTATIDNVKDFLYAGQSCFIRTDEFENIEQFNGITDGYLKVIKGLDGMCEISLNVPTSADSLYLGVLSSDNEFVKWEKSSGSKTYTTLDELGLTADATIDDVRNALQVGGSCIIRTDAFTDLTQFNGIQWGYLKITIAVNGMSDIWLNDVTSLNGLYYGRQSSGKFYKWVGISTQRTYTELVQLGLTADATVDDVLSKLQPGETFTAGINQFTNYQTLFPYDSSNDQYSRVFIQQGTSLATAYIKWFRKDGSREALANLNSNNKVAGWNEHTMNEIIHTSLIESLSGITTTLDLINALITEYRAKQKPVRFISGSLTKNQLTDLPSNYGLLDITVAGYDLVEVRFAQSEFGFKKMHYGFLNRTSSETLFSKLTWSKSNNIYYTIDELNAVKGINIELVKDEDNTIKIIEALGDREEFVEWFNNGSTMDRFGIPDEFGNKITYLRIVKTDSKYALIIATTNKGFTFSRVYNQGVLEDWCYDRTKATLVTNATTLKLDITKRNTSWYGAIKLTYLYDTSPVEVEISFRSATDDVRWAVINGQKYINKITYTQDSSNTAHYTIGIEFAGDTYGNYQVDVIGDFADINSLTKDAFTGTKTAVYYSPWGKNNGVSLVSAPEDIGLTFPCTSVQLAQAMRNKFNKTINAGAIGVFNNGGKTVCITDAPSDYGLLHIETFGFDRVMIRYDGIGSSNYAGSWIGKIKSSGGTFSGIDWEQFGYNDVALTTVAIPNSYITGTLQYEVKKGICYVSWENFKCTKTNFTYTLTSNKLPTPLRTACLPMYASTGEHIGVINIPKDGSTPTFVATDKISLASNGCFGYEIA